MCTVTRAVVVGGRLRFIFARRRGVGRVGGKRPTSESKSTEPVSGRVTPRTTHRLRLNNKIGVDHITISPTRESLGRLGTDFL